VIPFISNMLQQRPVNIYGDGEQTRDFTFAEDCAKANLSHARPKEFQAPLQYCCESKPA
jgi:nucleoside-diphosphate-sugar epimerase